MNTLYSTKFTMQDKYWIHNKKYMSIKNNELRNIPIEIIVK